MSAWSRRPLLTAPADLLEQVDWAVDPLGVRGHQPQPLDQALDVCLVQGDALHDLPVQLELDRCRGCLDRGDLRELIQSEEVANVRSRRRGR